ncbi:MAG: DUF2867 domain-containing protein [bacterium]
MKERVLVTGATGYVGGRLIPRLLREGYRVRAVSRRREKLKRAGWSRHPSVELREADALNRDSIKAAAQDCVHAYYLIHSMGMGSGDFADADRKAAQNFVSAAESNELDRIIYLGGLGHHHDGLSKHRQSRREVGEILQEGSVPVTILRAAMIVGSGSGSFELTRYCVEKLPIMLTHPYVRTPSQPIAVENVLTYLTESLEQPETAGNNYDIGGPDVLTGVEVMQKYARIAGLFPRIILPLPFISLEWSSRRMIDFLPLPEDLTYPLVKGSRNPAVVRDERIREIIPQTLLTVDEAIRRALEHPEPVSDTPNSIDGELSPPEWPRDYDPDWAGGTTYRDERTLRIDAEPEQVWTAIVNLASRNGLFFASWLRWLVRRFDDLFGLFDFPEVDYENPNLSKWGNLDFWTVQDFEEGKYIVLRGDFNLPGRPRLIYEIEPESDGTLCRQRAEFRPAGVLGRVYWSVISLFHYFSFSSMLEAIAREASDDVTENPVGVDV